MRFHLHVALGGRRVDAAKHLHNGPSRVAESGGDAAGDKVDSAGREVDPIVRTKGRRSRAWLVKPWSSLIVGPKQPELQPKTPESHRATVFDLQSAALPPPLRGLDKPDGRKVRATAVHWSDKDHFYWEPRDTEKPSNSIASAAQLGHFKM